MTDPVIADPLPKPIQTAETDLEKVKAWWKEYPVYCGMIAGAVIALVVRHFL